MKKLIINDWHFWQDNTKFFASDESCKQLFEYASFDAMVNGLFVMNAYVARRLNKEWNK